MRLRFIAAANDVDLANFGHVVPFCCGSKLALDAQLKRISVVIESGHWHWLVWLNFALSLANRL